MCEIVSILVPVGAASWFAEQKWPHVSFERDEGSWSSERLRRRAGSAYAVYHTPRGGCSCGKFTATSKPQPFEIDKVAERFVRRGMSRKKAWRAAEQSQRAHTRITTGLPDGFDPDLVTAAIGVCEHAGECGLISEWGNKGRDGYYDRALEVSCTPEQVAASDALEYENGRLYWIRPFVRPRSDEVC